MCVEIFAGFRCCGEDFSLEAVVFLLLKAPNFNYKFQFDLIRYQTFPGSSQAVIVPRRVFKLSGSFH